MKFKIALVGVGAALLVGALPVLAHHSFAAEYDQSKRVEFKDATFVRLDFVNPHSWVYFDVTDEKGVVQHWRGELGPPNGLYRSGLRPNMFKAGEKMSISGNLAKDASNLMWAGNFTTADGKGYQSRATEGATAPGDGK
jgi:hypothetical protein